VPRACQLVCVIVVAFELGACHHPRPVVIEDTCEATTVGEASVEFAPAYTREPRPGSTSNEQLVIQIRDGTAERAPIADAGVMLLNAGSGADSGHVIQRRTTPHSGTLLVDSLAARRYEVVVRRIGYHPAHQRITVRPGFTDTVRIALQGAAVCLVE
jgi:hypothetical protein